MLSGLRLKNFTVFPDASFEFAPGLNVIVGENGTGKSHVLKAGYCCGFVGWEKEEASEPVPPTKAHLSSAAADKLRGVFKPDELGRLVARKPGQARGGIEARFAPENESFSCSFHRSSKTEVTVEECFSAWLPAAPIFLPTRELLSIYPGFQSLYVTRAVPYEETWYDTCVLLGLPVGRGPRPKAVRHLLEALESHIGGKVILEGERFYVKTGTEKLEAHLVAEGLRKLATLARLIAVDELQAGRTLYWDEPEANLNPRLVKQVAAVILHLCRAGIQTIAATHSLFLLREFDILLKSPEFKGTPARFFGLHRTEDGMRVEQGETIDDIGPIAALDEDLEQSDRYLDAEEADA